jgi:N-methylhydantoinase A
MGGTSFDVSLVADGESSLSAQTSIDYGMIVRTPMIEITTIGAGGGSIAWVDRGGLLQVGPESAGSEPGPVCYGLGNSRPTVTDANLVLGRINADRPIGGKLDQLDVDAAKLAIQAHVGKPLGLEVMEAAEAIVRVANSKMAGAIRLVSIERGHNPNEFSAMPFGGGGALHAGALIKEVGLKSALVPRYPGVTSALGCTIADMRHDFVQTISGMLADMDIKNLQNHMTEMAAEGTRLLEGAKVKFDSRDTVFELDMSYLGQTHTVDVTLPVEFKNGIASVFSKLIEESFITRYTQVYGRPLEGIPVRVLNLRVSVIGRRPKFNLQLLAPKGDKSIKDAELGYRDVWVDGKWHQAIRYERLVLPVDAKIYGPALLEQPDTTVFIEPDLVGTVDDYGNLIITRQEQM